MNTAYSMLYGSVILNKQVYKSLSILGPEGVRMDMDMDNLETNLKTRMKMINDP